MKKFLPEGVGFHYLTDPKDVEAVMTAWAMGWISLRDDAETAESYVSRRRKENEQDKLMYKVWKAQQHDR